MYFTIIFAKKKRDGRYTTSSQMVDHVYIIRNCASHFFYLDQGIFLDGTSMVDYFL